MSNVSLKRIDQIDMLWPSVVSVAASLCEKTTWERETPGVMRRMLSARVEGAANISMIVTVAISANVDVDVMI